MKIDRTKNATRNIFWGIINKTVTLILPFIIRTILIYSLGTEYLGLSSLFSSILQVLSLAELGFGNAMVFSMYKPIAENDKATISALLNLYKRVYRIIGLIILLIGLTILPFLNFFIKGNPVPNINIYILFLIYLLNTVVSYFLFSYKNSLLVAHQRNDVISKVSTSLTVLLYLIQIYLLIVFKNYYLFVAVLPIFTIFTNIVNSYFADKLYFNYQPIGNLDEAFLKDLRKRISGLMLYKINGVFRNSFDSIVISAYLGLVVLAQYQNYYYIINAIIGILSIFTTSITAGVGNSIASETIEKNYSDFKKLQFMFMWLISWCTVCLLVMYQHFMMLWVGREHLLSTSMVVLFCIYFYTLKMGDIGFVYREAAGLWWEDKMRPVVESILNLVLNLILVRLIGLEGVIISTTISLLFVNFVWSSRTLFKFYFKRNLKEYFVRHLIYAARTLIACSVTFLIASYLPTDGWFWLIVKLIICIVVPNVTLLITSFNMQEFKETYLWIKRMFKVKAIKLRS